MSPLAMQTLSPTLKWAPILFVCGSCSVNTGVGEGTEEAGEIIGGWLGEVSGVCAGVDTGDAAGEDTGDAVEELIIEIFLWLTDALGWFGGITASLAFFHCNF